MSEKIKCPYCNRKFADDNAVRSHTKAKHGHQLQKSEPDESMADIFIQAQINRAMGVKNEDWIEDMLP